MAQECAVTRLGHGYTRKGKAPSRVQQAQPDQRDATRECRHVLYWTSALVDDERTTTIRSWAPESGFNNCVTRHHRGCVTGELSQTLRWICLSVKRRRPLPQSASPWTTPPIAPFESTLLGCERGAVAFITAPNAPSSTSVLVLLLLLRAAGTPKCPSSNC